MNVVSDFPPNYKDITKKIPAVKGITNVAFTFGPIIFAPGAVGDLSKDLMVHEQYHCQQQAEWSPMGWWDKYLADPEFRAQEELGAYQRQYRYARKHYSRQVFETLLDRIARDLSGPMYDHIYDFETAKELIRGKYK